MKNSLLIPLAANPISWGETDEKSDVVVVLLHSMPAKAKEARDDFGSKVSELMLNGWEINKPDSIVGFRDPLALVLVASARVMMPDVTAFFQRLL